METVTSSSLAPQVLSKAVDEWKHLAIDFERQLETGETLTGTPVVTASPSGLTLESPTSVDSQVRFFAKGGTIGITYTVRAAVTTSSGEHLTGSGELVVTAL